MRDHPGLVALREGHPAGFLIYRINQDEAVILALVSLMKRKGVATAMIGALEAHAHSAGASTCVVETTNDNLPALQLYQTRGFSITACQIGGFDQVQKIKGEAPLLVRGYAGIPIRDVIRLSKTCAPGAGSLPIPAPTR